MTTDEVKQRLSSEPDFIYSTRFGHSLKALLRRYQDGEIPPRVAAQVLMMTEDDVEALYQAVLVKLRALMTE